MSHVIDFIPPIRGIEDQFNTFRLGLFYSKRLKASDRVYLMDGKEKRIIGAAAVIDVSVGPLSDMLAAHAQDNHAVQHLSEGHETALFDILRRFYGPQIATLARKTTVVHLRRFDGTRGLQEIPAN